MPWSIMENHSKCPASRPWAVVKDASGEVEGCHASQADAQDQLAALHASESPRAGIVPERRAFLLDQVSLRAEGDDRPIKFRGMAALFGSRTWIGPPKAGFWEQVARGAFRRAVEGEDDVRFLVEHDPAKVLARSSAGSLRLAEDRKGLRVEADLAPTTAGRDLAILLQTGAVNEMSFGFVPVAETWSTTKDGAELRTLEEVQLFDVSAVSFPAYVGTEASLRTVEARRAEARSERNSALRRRLEAVRRDVT